MMDDGPKTITETMILRDNRVRLLREVEAKPREDLSAVAGLYQSETVCKQ